MLSLSFPIKIQRECIGLNMYATILTDIILSSRSGVLLENLVVIHMVNKFPKFN